VQKEFERSGLSQAELAGRMGKGADRVCRLLGAPGNWTLDTVSDLLFAISGSEAKYELSYPFEKPKRNLTRPEWLYDALGTPSQPAQCEQNLLISKQETPSVVPQRSIDPLDQLRAG
jgi:hypothetical protein